MQTQARNAAQTICQHELTDYDCGCLTWAWIQLRLGDTKFKLSNVVVIVDS